MFNALHGEEYKEIVNSCEAQMAEKERKQPHFDYSLRASSAL